MDKREINVFETFTKDVHKMDGIKNPIFDSKINWENYNWPICFKLVHFDLEEIENKIRYIFTL